MYGESFHVRVVEPASELCARDVWNILKYSVDPALTDIRGEFSVKIRKLIWVVTPAVGPLVGTDSLF